MTRILFVTPYYRPDGGPAAPLFSMLCESLVQKGYDVEVITGVPHYPSGKVPDTYKGIQSRRSKESGVRITRVPLPSINRENLFLRFVQAFTFQLNSLVFGAFKKYDVLITSSPAFELFLPFLYFSSIRNKPTIYSVHDVYPSVGIKLGIFRNRIIIEVVEALEKYFLSNADAIRVLSTSFIQELTDMGADDQKIELIYDWVKVENFLPLDKQNGFSNEYSLTDSFNVMYAGNIGHVQGLESMLKAAKILDSYKTIKFIFVGEGSAKSELLQQSSDIELENVIFIPYQPQERMNEVLASADLCIVTLKKGTAFGALPSKTYSIMASGRPIVASLDEGSDAWELIERSGAGICIPPESPKDLSEAIEKIYLSLELQESLGKNGREYVQSYHSPEYAAELFSKIIEFVKSSPDAN